MSYKQLTESQRHQIYVLLKKGCQQDEISEAIEVSESTVSREINRNKGKRGYRPKQAHEKALQRRHHSLKNKRLTKELKTIITKYLKKDWSPEQISGYLKREHEQWVSHETIYQFVYEDQKNNGTLYKHLRRSKKKRKKRSAKSDRRGQIESRISIHDRSRIIENRERIGDWELDTIIGKHHKQAIVTVVDRLSLLTLIAKVERRTSDLVTQAVIELLKPYKGKATFSATGDNGKEFAGHKEIAQALGLNFYFADPYSSWQRGTNENTNGLIRQYLPKGCSFDDVGQEDCIFIMDRINTRPRKTLNFCCANEVFASCLKAA